MNLNKYEGSSLSITKWEINLSPHGSHHGPLNIFCSRLSIKKGGKNRFCRTRRPYSSFLLFYFALRLIPMQLSILDSKYAIPLFLLIPIALHILLTTGKYLISKSPNRPSFVHVFAEYVVQNAFLLFVFHFIIVLILWLVIFSTHFRHKYS